MVEAVLEEVLSRAKSITTGPGARGLRIKRLRVCGFSERPPEEKPAAEPAKKEKPQNVERGFNVEFDGSDEVLERALHARLIGGVLRTKTPVRFVKRLGGFRGVHTYQFAGPPEIVNAERIRAAIEKYVEKFREVGLTLTSEAREAEDARTRIEREAREAEAREAVKKRYGGK